MPSSLWRALVARIYSLAPVIRVSKAAAGPADVGDLEFSESGDGRTASSKQAQQLPGAALVLRFLNSGTISKLGYCEQATNSAKTEWFSVTCFASSM